jgi:predicted phosphodiesterase
MRVQIASDLHHEFSRAGHLGSEGIPVADGVDVLVLAGDIHAGARAFDLYRNYPVPIVYVHGNHELYGAEMFSLVHQLRSNANVAAVNFLERDEVVIDGVRFLGTCLWTDYCLRPVWKRVAMSEADMSMTDHRVIRYAGARAFSSHDAETEHLKARDWLEKKLDTHFDGKTVVVTHHAPHPRSIPSEYVDDILSAAFASDLTPLVEQADVWIHGHVHRSADYRVGKCRVICNPRGYPGRHSKNPVPVAFENPSFDPALVIDI